MRVDKLPSPGLLSNGIGLRNYAAQAISSVEVLAARTQGGKPPAAAKLQAFFLDCADALSSLVDEVPPVANSTTRDSATQLTVTFSKDMDQTILPASSTITVSAGSVLSLSWVSNRQLRITGTGFTSPVATYTAPGTNGIRDLSGNPLASGTLD